MDPYIRQPGPFGHQSGGRGGQVLIELDEATGQRPAARVRGPVAPPHQSGQSLLPHGQHDEVDGDGDPRN
jgi:hypothetical protein